MNPEHEEAQAAVVAVLKRSLLLIRSALGSKDYEAAAIEAYHVHNLPDLLKSSAPVDLLRFYWEVERPDYLSQAKPSFAETHEADWEKIKVFLEAERKKGTGIFSVQKRA